MNLTDKQKRFADEYLIDLNATQAAIRAGYSEKTAKEIGYENLTKPHIHEYIQQRQKELSAKLEITQEQVLAEYAKIGFSDIRKAFQEADDTMKPVSEFDENIAKAISSVEIIEHRNPLTGELEGYTKKLKFWDKKAGLDGICRMLGFYAPEKKDVSISMEQITGMEVK